MRQLSRVTMSMRELDRLKCRSHLWRVAFHICRLSCDCGYSVARELLRSKCGEQ